jgi:hypothetical protein
MVDLGEHSDEVSGSETEREFLGQMNNCLLLSEESVMELVSYHTQ